MKVGDKVVCIDNNNWMHHIPFNKILTIQKIDYVYIKFKEFDSWYIRTRFLSIKDIRKKKLQKISQSNER